MNQADKILQFIHKVSKMTADGEYIDGDRYHMLPDDAFDTLNALIEEARNILKGK